MCVHVCYNECAPTITRSKYHLFHTFFTCFMAPLYLMMANSCMKSLKKLACEPQDTALDFKQLVHHTDRSIIVDDCCTGCATCTKVCPADNIELINSIPVFGRRCEMCFACDEWCPAGAIQHWGRANGVKYHHPEVKLSDMMIR